MTTPHRATARFLSSPPISGSIRERHYEAFGACTWVEFTPEFDQPWAGVFGHQGYSASSGVFSFVDAPLAFVIACGVGWIVNVDDGQLMHKTDQEGLVTAIAIDDKPYMVAAGWTELYVYNSSGLVWSSDGVAMDGIQFDKSENGSVIGRCWQSNGWYSFRLTQNPWRVVTGSFLTSQW